jgi:hypothetical protein
VTRLRNVRSQPITGHSGAADRTSAFDPKRTFD